METSQLLVKFSLVMGVLHLNAPATMIPWEYPDKFYQFRN